MASPYITGGASLFLTMLEKDYADENKDFTWNELRKEFRKRYIPVNQLDRKRNLSKDIKQTHTYDEYVEQFLGIVTSLDMLTENEKMYHFKEGLKYKYRIEMETVGIQTLVNAIELGQRLDHVMQRDNAENKVKQVNYAGHNHNHRQNNQRHYSQQYNRFENRQSKPQWQNRPISREKSNYSPQNSSANQYRSTTTSFKQKTPTGKVECYRCHKLGHFARDCRVKTLKRYTVQIWQPRPLTRRERTISKQL